MKGLVIKDEWLEKILSRQKTWELRSRSTNIRGNIALVKKGSGHVFGIAQLVEVKGPLSEAELHETISKHCVTANLFQPFSKFKWRYAWVLKNVIVLSEPVPYHHRPGAVIWVTLDESCIDRLSVNEKTKTKPHSENQKQPIFANDDTETIISNIRTVTLTQGNINNGHIYLAEIIDWFPKSIIGGSSSLSSAPKEVSIDWGSSEAIKTDIAGDKKIFRKRGWIKSFFSKFELREGDRVSIEKIGDFAYRVYPARDSE